MKKEMNKRYLSAIAALFIVTITASTFIPVYGQVATTGLYAQGLPTLTVKTIAEDDELHHTGIMVLGIYPTSGPFANLFLYDAYLWGATKYLSQFKVSVSYNGVPVTAKLTCEVIEKDKVNALKTKQGDWENLITVPKDMTDNFVCKYRESKPGVGVIDVYWAGPSSTSPILSVGQFIADYILVVTFAYTVGHTVVYGTEMQDICILGFPTDPSQVEHIKIVTKPDGTEHYVWPNVLNGYKSCEDIALIEKAMLGIPIAWV
jgi:hypothetical protein